MAVMVVKHQQNWIFFRTVGLMNYITVKPRYPDTLRTRKECRHKRSVEVTGVGKTYAYKKVVFFLI